MSGLLKELAEEQHNDLLWLWLLAGTALFGQDVLQEAIKGQEPALDDSSSSAIPEQSKHSRVHPKVWVRVHELFNAGWTPKRIRDHLKAKFGKTAITHAHIAELKYHWNAKQNQLQEQQKMDAKRIRQTREEAMRFARAANKALDELKLQARDEYVSGTKCSAALRRASMELTRALAELRRP